jgi:hypothetical protein
MTLTFGSPANLGSEFRTTVTVFGILVVVLVAAFSRSRRDSAPALTFKTRCVLSLLGFMGVVWYAHSTTYQQFVSADVDAAGVRLVFVGPFSREVAVPSGRITAVRWGTADRGSSRCRISIEAASATYYSAWLSNKSDICKGMRDEILRTLRNVTPPT